MRKKNSPDKKELRAERETLRRLMSVYFAAHILLFSAYALRAGAAAVRRGTERVWYGTCENCITVEDLNKWAAQIRGRLQYYYNNIRGWGEIEKTY